MLGLRPFDVQLIGAMILHNGEIAEMRTGEGKTLVAVLPAYLNALSGKGVQVCFRPSDLVHACCARFSLRGMGAHLVVWHKKLPA